MAYRRILSFAAIVLTTLFVLSTLLSAVSGSIGLSGPATCDGTIAPAVHPALGPAHGTPPPGASGCAPSVADQAASAIFDPYALTDLSKQDGSAQITPRIPGWPTPNVNQTFGDDFDQKTIFVHQQNDTFLDDLLYCAAVPAAVHWEGSTRHQSLIVSDSVSRETGNLVGDWSEYLGNVQARPTVDFIGSGNGARKATLTGYFDNVSGAYNVTSASDAYSGASDIALFYWEAQRQLYIDTAVLAYVPGATGGPEVVKNTTGTGTGVLTDTSNLAAQNVSWLKYILDWSDPGADTDYRGYVQDPYVAHNLTYQNWASNGHVNPTDNNLLTKAGHNEVALSPYFSYLPYQEHYNTAPSGHQKFSGNVPIPTDYSLYPATGAADLLTFQFGPVAAGQKIYVESNWTDPNTDFNTYIYPPYATLDDDFLLEIDNAYWADPEGGACFAPYSGMYNVTVHLNPYVLVGGEFTCNVYWETPASQADWDVGQSVADTDAVNYQIREYAMAQDAMAYSVSNGAVLASLLNVPMLYTAGSTPEVGVVQALKQLGVKNLIVIDPSNKITTSGWASQGFSVSHKATAKDVFISIYNVSKSKGLDKAVVLNPQGGPWFTGAALEGAYHGAPIPVLSDPAFVHIENTATWTWWEMVQWSDAFVQTTLYNRSTPNAGVLERMSDEFFAFLGAFSPDFNPACGDANHDGIPDSGGKWNYSGDVDVIIVSPMNAIKPILDRAINGKASVGRIPCDDPAALWAVVAREMLYWAVGYSSGDNPDDPDDSPAMQDHWESAGWTFVAYTHDDGLLDDDMGDDTDDDYCGVADGGAISKSYYMRQELPAAAALYGKTNDYHTYYTNTSAMLEGGTCFWSHNDHGSHNSMMEQGAGFTGMSQQASDPQWEGPPDVDSLVNPPIDPTSGEDWYYAVDNLHSTFAMMIDCETGGSKAPEYLMKMGAVGVVGDVYSMYIDPSPVFADRMARGVFTGKTFGDSHRWAIDESSSVYSMKDPGPSDGQFDPDNKDFRLGESVQTILYGDPDLVMIRPTLLIDVNWAFPKDAHDVTFYVTVRDQSGTKTSPDSITVLVDSQSLTGNLLATGEYKFKWTVSQPTADHMLKVVASSAGKFSPKGQSTITREYDLIIPQLDIAQGNATYIGGLTQTVSANTTADYPAPFATPVTGGPAGNAVSAKARLYNDNDINTGLGADLAYDAIGGGWSVTGLNVSTLPEGDYYVLWSFGANYVPVTTLKGPSFTIAHRLYFNTPHQTYDPISKLLSITNVTVRCTYVSHNPLEPVDLITRTYEVFKYNGGPTNITMSMTGDLSYDVSSMTYETLGLDVSALPQGNYYVKLAAEDIDSGVWTYDLPNFTVGMRVYVWTPLVTYTAGLAQNIDIQGARLTTSQNQADIITPDQVQVHTYSVLSMGGTAQNITGNLTFDSNLWGATGINVSGLAQGAYFVMVFFKTNLAQGENRSLDFNVTHDIVISRPVIEYTPALFQRINITSVSATNSYSKVGKVTPLNAVLHGYEVLTKAGGITGIKGDLDYDTASGTWNYQRLDVSSLVDGEYVVRATVSTNSSNAAYQDSSAFAMSHFTQSSMPVVLYDHANQTIDVAGFVVKASRNHGGDLTESLVSAHYFKVYRNSDDNDTGITGNLSYVNASWEARGIGVSTLDPADHYVICTLVYNGKDADGRSESFRVIHDLTVFPPKAAYDPNTDTIRIWDAKAYTTAPGIGYLDNHTAATKRVEIYGAGDKVYYTNILDHNGSAFFKDVSGVKGRNFLEGQYYVKVFFATNFSSEVAAASQPFNVTFKAAVDDDTDDDDTGDDDMFPGTGRYGSYICAAIIIGLVILLVVVAVIVAVVYKRQKDAKKAGKADKEEDEGEEWDADDEAEFGEKGFGASKKGKKGKGGKTGKKKGTKKGAKDEEEFFETNCPECGATVFSDEDFCPTCGEELHLDTGKKAPKDDDEFWLDDVEDEEPTPPKKGKAGKKDTTDKIGKKQPSETDWDDEDEPKGKKKPALEMDWEDGGTDDPDNDDDFAKGRTTEDETPEDEDIDDDQDEDRPIMGPKKSRSYDEDTDIDEDHASEDEDDYRPTPPKKSKGKPAIAWEDDDDE